MNFNAIFVACFTNLRVHSQNNDVLLPQDIWNPPGKGGFLGNVSHSILGNLNRVQSLQYFQINLLVWAIGPFNKELPKKCGLMHTLVPLCIVEYLSAILVASPIIHDPQCDTVRSLNNHQHQTPWRCLKQWYSNYTPSLFHYGIHNHMPTYSQGGIS
jgi:hypothetical protein